MRKIESLITRLKISEATYSNSNTVISPTLINFFFGNNGSGKSTIAKTINKSENLSWKDNIPPSDFYIHTYNAEYVANNISNYHNLPGVFTFGEINIDIQNKIDELNKEKEKLSDELSLLNQEQTKITNRKTELKTKFTDKTWSAYTKYKNAFSEAFQGFKTKSAFVERLLKQTHFDNHEWADLVNLYDAAYSSDNTILNEFYEITNVNILDDIEDIDLLNKQIISSSNTPFAEFIKALNATSWVKQGLDHYHESAKGKCIYCQQTLPSNFKDEITKCFDRQFENDTKKIMDLYGKYRELANKEFMALSNIPVPNIIEQDKLDNYKNKLDALKGIIATNIQLITNKQQNYASEIQLEKTSDLFEEIRILVSNFNEQIRTYNDILTSKSVKRDSLKNMLWEKLGHDLSEITSTYNDEINALDLSLKNNNQRIETIKASIKEITYTISEDMKNIVNTKATIDNINTILKDTGFQGFSIREKSNIPNVYEVVRQDNSLAVNLSEGEKNFLAFLYFYHQVKGNPTPNSNTSNKIVVIDDPVSSMDSGSLFIIASLIRELIKICENNATPNNNYIKDRYIKQLFIFTHNTYFHKEISYESVKYYPYVNLYLVTKTDNQSFIKLCEKNHPNKLDEKINYNPVQNSYSALWEEYKVLNTPIPLMNVIRRILEYYFLQLCGYDGTTLREVILNRNKDKFIKIDNDGNHDYTMYQIASAMLSYIHSNSTIGISDGMYYVDDTVDIQQSKETFKLIFELMNQNQHFEMMMNTNV